MGKMSKIYGGLDEEFRLPRSQKLSKEEKSTWLHNKLREVLENNSVSQVKAENLRKYTESLEEVVDYILGIGDYRRLSNEARRIVMFLLSTNKVWATQENTMYRKYASGNIRELGRWQSPLKVLKFLNADLLPDFRKKLIIKFINGFMPSKKLQDWEVEILENLEISNTQAIYLTGRIYRDIVIFRRNE